MPRDATGCHDMLARLTASPFQYPKRELRLRRRRGHSEPEKSCGGDGLPTGTAPYSGHWMSCIIALHRLLLLRHALHIPATPSTLFQRG